MTAEKARQFASSEMDFTPPAMKSPMMGLLQFAAPMPM